MTSWDPDGTTGPGHTHPFSISPWRVQYSLLHWPQLTSFFFKYLSGCVGSSSGTRDIRSLLQHMGSLVVACELLAAAWEFQCSWPGIEPWVPCTGSLESTIWPPGKSQLTSFALHLYLHNLSSPGNLPLSWELSLLSPQASSVWLPPSLRNTIPRQYLRTVNSWELLLNIKLEFDMWLYWLWDPGLRALVSLSVKLGRMRCEK